MEMFSALGRCGRGRVANKAPAQKTAMNSNKIMKPYTVTTRPSSWNGRMKKTATQLAQIINIRAAG